MRKQIRKNLKPGLRATRPTDVPISVMICFVPGACAHARHRRHTNGFIVAGQVDETETSGKMRQAGLAPVAAQYRLLLFCVTVTAVLCYNGRCGL